MKLCNYIAILTLIFLVGCSKVDSPIFGLYKPNLSIVSLRYSFTEGHSEYDILNLPKVQFPFLGRWDGNEISLMLYDSDKCSFTFFQNLEYQKVMLRKVNVDCRKGIGQVLVGDWNGDRTTDLAIYDPNLGKFYFYLNSKLSFEFYKSIDFGLPGANYVAVSGDWGCTGKYSVALYRPNDKQFDFLNQIRSSEADNSFRSTLKGDNLKPFSMKDGNCSFVGLYNPKLSKFNLFATNGGALKKSVIFGDPNASFLPISLN